MPQHVQVIYQNKNPDNRVFTVPDKHKNHLPDRLASTPGDNIAEYAGKLCYDSLLKPKGRSSGPYHEHIHEVGHLSVYAHAVETFSVSYGKDPADGLAAMAALHCRPGVWVTSVSRVEFRFSISLRAIIEWEQHGPEGQNAATAACLHSMLLQYLRPQFPLTLAPVKADNEYPMVAPDLFIRPCDPLGEREQWVSLYMSGVSRDLLQELVRHHYQANPSVRSTRYCDESGAKTVMPPAAAHNAHARGIALFARIYAQRNYTAMFTAAKDLGLNEKAARGVARSCLLGATETELVYSLSRFQAKHILGLRVRPHADQEISDLADKMREALLPVWGAL
jgi:thymidylate synthase ThyX